MSPACPLGYCDSNQTLLISTVVTYHLKKALNCQMVSLTIIHHCVYINVKEHYVVDVVRD